MKKLLTIEGMSCGHCVMKVKSALARVPGVSRVDVDLLKKSAMVEGDALVDHEVGYGAALSVIMTVVVVGLGLLYAKFRREGDVDVEY